MTGSLRAILSLAILLAFCALPGAAGAQTNCDPAAPPAPVFTGEKITLEVQNADLGYVLRSIAGVSGKNVVVSEGVSGRLTLKLVDMPWDQALDVVLASQNLALEESDNVLIIYDQATLQRLQANRPKPTGGE